jgi:hypothetical protein
MFGMRRSDWLPTTISISQGMPCELQRSNISLAPQVHFKVLGWAFGKNREWRATSRS